MKIDHLNENFKNKNKTLDGWNIPIKWNITIMDENASNWMKNWIYKYININIILNIFGLVLDLSLKFGLFFLIEK